MTLKETPRRRFSAWLLLAVFVPMLLLSSLHTHGQASSADASCQECVEHHCGGHMGQQALSLHDCVLCQALSLPFLLVMAVVLAVFVVVHKASIGAGRALCPSADVGVRSSRAPPCLS